MMPERSAQIVANLEEVRRRIAAAAYRAGRSPTEIQLVAVSKTYPLEDIVAALAAGQVDFGESRLEELWAKVEAARDRQLSPLRWHLIGTIQSRKSDAAIGPFALIHSVDRMKLAVRLSRDAVAAGTVMAVLLEVNVSGEASKHGFTPDEVRAEAAALQALPGLRVAGLMTMAPYGEPDQTRPVFRTLRQLRDEMAAAHPGIEWPHLSMGMTNDFEVAIEEGATHVRIGSAIFGLRDYGAAA